MYEATRGWLCTCSMHSMHSLISVSVQAREQREQLQEQLRQLRELLQDDREAGGAEAALAMARDADAAVDRRKAAITVETLEQEVRIPPPFAPLPWHYAGPALCGLFLSDHLFVLSLQRKCSFWG